jgi:hypothetical protein
LLTAQAKPAGGKAGCVGLNERIEAFLQDVLALEGEIWNLSREGALTSHVGSPCLEYTKAECAQFFAIVDLGHDAPRHDALWQVPARRFRGASGRIRFPDIPSGRPREFRDISRRFAES